MKTLKQLRQMREAAQKKMQDVLAESNGTIFNAEQRTAFDAAKLERENIDQQIKDIEAMQEGDRTGDTAPGFDASAGHNRAEDKPWANGGEFLMAVKSFGKTRGHAKDPRLFAGALGQNETIDTEGGFLVPPEMASGLITRTIDSGLVVGRARTRPMGSARLIINGIDDSNRVGGPAGAGVIVYRIAEAGLINISKLKFRRVELNANKLVGAYAATDEVLEDAPALQAEIEDYFPLAFAWRMDNEALNGTGQGQFLGINNSGAIVITPKTAGQAPGTFTTQNALDMRARLWVGSRKNAVWFCGPDIEELLFQLTIPGPQGTNVALYTPPGVNGNNSPYGLLLNMPVIVIEQTAAAGTQGDIILADMQQYVIGERAGLKFASSIHVQFLTDEQVFRWTLRNDGQPLWDKPVTQNNSANKVSPFVVLASRF